MLHWIQCQVNAIKIQVLAGLSCTWLRAQLLSKANELPEKVMPYTLAICMIASWTCHPDVLVYELVALRSIA